MPPAWLMPDPNLEWSILGNIIEPPKVMKNYPVDALRYWSAEAGLGKNLRFDEKELKNGHRLMTKLWNASRFSGFFFGTYMSC